jgi:adenosylmethionine-8-amino-7-oxononanoate aminotransferase
MIAPLLHPFAPPSRPRDAFTTIVRGEGAVVYDQAGTGYIDAVASLWYMNIGYGRSEMAEAIAAAAGALGAFHTFGTFTNEPAEALAAKVAAVSPFPEPRVFFCSSGSEAVDTAMKLARVAHAQAGAPERVVVVSRQRAYHGVNYGGASVSGLPVNQEGFGPFVGSTLTVDPDDLGKMEATFAAYPGEIAAVITEPVQGAGGVWPPPDGYLAGLRQLCDDNDAFLIFDEVITGFGRLGTWFAAERYGVVPDMITFAKAITSGYVPLGGAIVGETVREPLEADPEFVLHHGYTYSGHPTATAAGLKNVEILEREGLLERAGVIEERLGAGLHDIGGDGRLAAVRGVGGMWAVATPPGVEVTAVTTRMRSHGVLARAAYGNLIFCPPLVTTDDQLDTILGALDASLD